jgi:hypothetical protein
LVQQFIRASPAISGYGIRLIYRRPETITFFAKEAPFVVPAGRVNVSRAWRHIISCGMSRNEFEGKMGTA